MTWRRPFAWRGTVRGVVTNPYQPGQGPKRHAVSLPIDTYVALVGIADEYGTTMGGAVELLTRDLPVVAENKRAYARPEGP